MMSLLALALAGNPACEGRFPLPASLLGGGVIVIAADRTVAIEGLCQPVRGKQKALQAGRRIRARWRPCTGLGLRVRLHGTIVDQCGQMIARLKIGRARAEGFGAARIACGDGVVDAGEECDGTCAEGRLCGDDCHCLPPGATTTLPPPFPGLPSDIGGYDGWLRLNAAPIPPRTADPHNGTKNVYVNQTRTALAPGGTQAFPFPDGSIVVKAARSPGRDFLGLFAIMRKRAGSDPAHGDWQFIEYFRSSASQPFSEVGRDGGCWGCHGQAIETDYVYTPLQ